MPPRPANRAGWSHSPETCAWDACPQHWAARATRQAPLTDHPNDVSLPLFLPDRGGPAETKKHQKPDHGAAKKKATPFAPSQGLASGGHGIRTRNPFRGTTFPVWPLAIRLPSGPLHLNSDGQPGRGQVGNHRVVETTEKWWLPLDFGYANVFYDLAFVGQRFRSPIAQLVEQAAVNRWVPGSSPGRGAFRFSANLPDPQVDARGTD